MHRAALMRRIDSSGSNSDVSSEDDTSDVSDLDKFEEAYSDFGALTAGVDPRTLERDCSGHTNEDVPGLDLPGQLEALYSLANVPLHWACTVGLCGVWCVGWVGGFFALVTVFFATIALRLPIYQMLRYFNVSCDMSFSWM